MKITDNKLYTASFYSIFKFRIVLNYYKPPCFGLFYNKYYVQLYFNNYYHFNKFLRKDWIDYDFDNNYQV